VENKKGLTEGGLAMGIVRKVKQGAVMLAAGLLLAAPMAIAQQPHEGEATGRRGPNAAEKPVRPPEGRGQMGMHRGAMEAGRPSLLANEKVKTEVIQADNGVTILITSEDPQLAAQIKEQIPEHVDWLKKMGRMLRNRPGAEGQPQAMANTIDPEKLKTNIEMAENGAAIHVTSDDPQQVALIKQILPRQIAVMRQFAARFGGQGGMEHMGQMREFLNLLLSDKVKLAVEEKDGSVILKLTPENPEDVQKLKDTLEKRLNDLEQLRGRLNAMGVGAGGPPPFAGGPQGAGGPGAPGMSEGPSTRPGVRHPVDPQMREMIREEIRRYLEEQKEKK
jgi:hypothetical protein